MATIAAMAPCSARMAGRFCQAARNPLRKASPMAESRSTRLRLKRLAATAGLLGVGIGDAEPGPTEAILIINHRAGEIYDPAFIDKQTDAVAEKFFVARFARG